MPTVRSNRASADVLGQIAALALMAGSDLARLGAMRDQISDDVWQRLSRLDGLARRIHELASKGREREIRREDE